MSKIGTAQQKVTTTFQIKPNIFKKLNAYCKKNGTSKVSVLNEALDQFLKTTK